MYAWGCFHLAYVRRHNVSVSLGSGRYRVASGLRFTPGVGNHLGPYSGSYQQYKQIQIQICLYLHLGFQRRVQEYHVIDDSFLDSFLFLTNSYQPDYLISFLLSFHLLASNPLVLVHYPTSPSRVPYRYQSAQRKFRGPVTFRLWGWKFWSHTWIEISRTKFFVRWGEM